VPWLSFLLADIDPADAWRCAIAATASPVTTSTIRCWSISTTGPAGAAALTIYTGADANSAQCAFLSNSMIGRAFSKLCKAGMPYRDMEQLGISLPVARLQHITPPISVY